MKTSGVPRNAYTYTPEQHTNSILGSLQLLFWLFFRPSALRNHLERIDPALDSNSSLIILLRQGRWRNLALWRLFIQGCFILPILANLLLGLVLWTLGEPIANIAFRVAFGMALGVAEKIDNEYFNTLIILGLLFGIPGGLGFGVAGGLVHGVALGVAYGVIFAVLFFLGITINLWRPIVLYPSLQLWNLALYRLEKNRINQPSIFLRLSNIFPYRINQRRNNETFIESILPLPSQQIERSIDQYSSLLRYHSAFWDQFQRIPLYGLDKYLLLVIEHNPSEGEAAIDYLNESLQHWAVQICKDALSLRKCGDVEAISQVHRTIEIEKLGNSINSVLRIFTRISQDVNAALEQRSNYNQRIALKYVTEKLNGQLENFNRTNNKYASYFLPFAKRWLDIINKKIEELAIKFEQNKEIDNPYIIGVPLTLKQEIFTGCDDIGLRIEQLLLDRRRPPLLLYGQRRMGKTSLLNNIGKLLPSNIIPMFVDLQGAPSSASDHAGFLYNLARDMEKSAKKQGLTLPSLAREILKSDPFTYFYEWLDKVEQALEQNTALLALDEFEVLDNAIAKGRFDEQDILGMLRHLIQHRPRFKVLLAGSHTIEEYQRWASYLINVQVVHISYLKEAEVRQLIECPVKDFTLRYEPNAVERVLQLTRCHPFLVQLLCAEIIVLKNEQDPSIRRLAILADVEAAIPEALQSGSFFFADIQNNQVDATGQAILRFIAAQGEGAIVSRQTLLQQFPDANITFSLLLQRELIEEVDDGYRFQVELIRRWFI
ncbi:AAA family ATPase [uncultured Nostoc sp.]|uniref:AAA family ATPase n=1 Tax=uncultured Nostoc sp. TaxID=340711 RepID=UPI002622C47A|nr:AAA family ATPase [uncultured Nostoc sp.]